MSSMCSTLRLWLQPWTNRSSTFVFLRPSRSPALFSVSLSSAFKDGRSSVVKSNQALSPSLKFAIVVGNSLSLLTLAVCLQLGYDPSEEIFGLGADMSHRDSSSSVGEPRSWFGPNGQYIRELPCPSCRGRGYTPCSKCGIERPRLDCSQCYGKGMLTCGQCSGDCVIWQESIDERPWEKARSSSPVKVKEDDEVDNIEVQLKVRRKSKRVYQSTSPEVGLKISRSLKSLNAKTGMFSKRMKIIHHDPALRAQRTAAIKKTKGTVAARKRASETMKQYFSDPENRRKRSITMQGRTFHCSLCGVVGHRRYYCPELKGKIVQWTCSLCGEKGHNRRGCWKLKTRSSKRKVQRRRKCGVCGKYGHNKRTCPLPPNTEPTQMDGASKAHHCKLCGQTDHNKRTCSRVKRRCTLCGRPGHYRSTCSISLVLDDIDPGCRNGALISLDPVKAGRVIKVES